jgi:hypothetical protein
VQLRSSLRHAASERCGCGINLGWRRFGGSFHMRRDELSNAAASVVLIRIDPAHRRVDRLIQIEWGTGVALSRRGVARLA